jgi:hypothetical protein
MGVRRVARGPKGGPAGDPAALAVRIARGARAALLAGMTRSRARCAGPARLARPLQVVCPREAAGLAAHWCQARPISPGSRSRRRGLAFELLREAGEPRAEAISLRSGSRAARRPLTALDSLEEAAAWSLPRSPICSMPASAARGRRRVAGGAPRRRGRGAGQACCRSRRLCSLPRAAELASGLFRRARRSWARSVRRLPCTGSWSRLRARRASSSADP